MPLKFKPTPKQGRPDEAAKRASRQADEALSDNPLTGSVTVDVSIPAPTTTTTVQHPLGRTPQGVIFEAVQASSALSNPLRWSAADEKTITLHNDTGILVTFRVRLY